MNTTETKPPLAARAGSAAELKRKVAELTQLLRETRSFRIGGSVPLQWFQRRDKAIGNPGVICESPNATGSPTGEKDRQ